MIDDAMGRAEFAVRLPEPVGQHAILGNAIEHAVRSHDGRVHGAREDQRSHRDDERMKAEPQRERAHQIHGQAANQILQILPRTLSGMIMTAKNDTSEVNSRL